MIRDKGLATRSSGIQTQRSWLLEKPLIVSRFSASSSRPATIATAIEISRSRCDAGQLADKLIDNSIVDRLVGEDLRIRSLANQTVTVVFCE
jgi:hypothetical protein